MKTLLFFTNNFQHAIKTLPYICNVAQNNNYLVEIINVVSITTQVYQGLFSIGEKFQQETEEEAKKLLNKIESYIKDNYDNIQVKLVIRKGFISNEIISAITENDDIETLVLSLPSTSTTKGKTISYIMEQIGQAITIPVTVVPIMV